MRSIIEFLPKDVIADLAFQAGEKSCEAGIEITGVIVPEAVYYEAARAVKRKYPWETDRLGFLGWDAKAGPHGGIESKVVRIPGAGKEGRNGGLFDIEQDVERDHREPVPGDQDHGYGAGEDTGDHDHDGGSHGERVRDRATAGDWRDADQPGHGHS